ncbi:MAG: ATP-binding protein [Deltaproteobacteria bacterium]|nr:ATP-binding protein [Deltaproteobacteria bacterium]
MRYLTPEIVRFFAEEAKMAFVAGPRQVGKTTLAKHLLHQAGMEAFYFNWDIESHRKAIIKNPEDFWERAAPIPSPRKPRICLDEIHKYPRWKRFLKGFFDARGKDLEVLVTGSGRLDIYQRGGDSLLGRYHLYHLHPFTLGEMLRSDRKTVHSPEEFWQNLLEGKTLSGARESLRDLETLTGFPEPLFSGSEIRLRRWRHSRETLVIREDLRDLTRIREIGLLETLVALLPDRIGSPLSVNALREDLGVNFMTVQGWLEALERLYYLFKIRPYAGTLTRTLRREEKVYLFDFSAIENPGAKFENLVALHLHKLCEAWTDWGYGDFALYYVRDREKREVDFLITDRRKPHALVETKLTASDVDSTLRYFADRLKPKYAVQVVREPGKFKSIFTSKGVMFAPATHFLSFI